MKAKSVGGYSATEARAAQEKVEDFVSHIKSRLVFVKGGTFLMGDFGSSHGDEKLPLDGDKDSKPLHEVVLSDYHIDKYKITNEDFGFYLKYHGYSARTDVGELTTLFSSLPRLPAPVDWFEADRYCSWLGDITGLPFSLPTEAQWEYAARNRGQFLAVATDSGDYNYHTAENGEIVGVNISSSWDRDAFSREVGWSTNRLTPLPVDRYPPNPLGVYSMSDNGLEWVKDWYDPEYYKNSPLKDPQGPETPMHQDYFGRDTKVVRGQSLALEYWPVGVNVHRKSANQHGYFQGRSWVNFVDKTARCVVNGE